jgi:general secretion pathway protein G
MKARRGFTMVEMLTVIVIIGMLAGITMKLMVYVNQKTAKARTNGDIERIKHALTEYHSVYGIYPPVTKMGWMTTNGLDKSQLPPANPDGGYGLSDGLATYLFGDDQADKWAHYVEDLKSDTREPQFGNNANYGDLVWSNCYLTIKDPWDREYLYTSVDPYVAFKLYSKGPDGVAGTDDDIGTKFNE